MKKFLAILLACVMTLALAVPAMASGIYDININPSIQHGTVTADIPTSLNGSLATLTITPDPGYKLDTLTVLDGDCMPVNVNISGDTASFIMPESDVTVTAVFEPEVQTTIVTEINATVTAELGQRVYDTVPTFTSDPEDGVEYLGSSTYWYRVPAGVDYDTCDHELIETVGQDAVFENGYTYFKVMIFGVRNGYELVEDETMLYLNSSETFFLAESVYAINGIVDFTFGGTQPTTNDTTTTTTTTSTTVKTGDSTNAMFYVITLIALIAAAGVTLFATKKSR